MTARPFIKWAGGKTRLLPELRARLPQEISGRYFEPFLGGAALFLNLRPARAVLSDLNEDLVRAYCAIRDDVEGVIGALQAHEFSHSMDPHTYYLVIRDRWNANRCLEQGAAGSAAAFIYLNKAGFNGLYRVNRRGAFNVPPGATASGKPPLILDTDNLRAVSRALADVAIAHVDAHAATATAGTGDAVYFDPPYDVPEGGASFTAYTSSPFGPDQQRDLAQHAALLVRRGAHVLLSNADTPAMRALYGGLGFRIETVLMPRSINASGSGRGKVTELLISGIAG